MGSKNQRLSVPQPGNVPSAASANGGKAYNALSNHSYFAITAGSGTGTATAGSLINGGLSFTPKVSGRVLVQWAAGGTAANVTANATFTPSVGAQTGPIMAAGAAPSSTGGETIASAGSFIATGLVVGTPVTANIAYTSNNGITQGNGSLSIIELPA